MGPCCCAFAHLLIPAAEMVATPARTTVMMTPMSVLRLVIPAACTIGSAADFLVFSGVTEPNRVPEGSLGGRFSDFFCSVVWDDASALDPSCDIGVGCG